VEKKPVAIDDLAIWKTDKPKTSWQKKAYRIVLVLAVFIAPNVQFGINKVTEYFAAHIQRVTQDLRTGIPSFVAHGDKYRISLSLFNAGNRPSTVREILPVFPLEIISGTSSLFSNPSGSTVQGISAPVKEGTTQSVIIEGTLPITQMYEYGHREGAGEEHIRKATLELHFQAEKFTGEMYQGVCKVVEISVNSERVVGWSNSTHTCRFFDEHYRSRQRVWLPLTLTVGSTWWQSNPKP
jgi:hypothetical protein